MMHTFPQKSKSNPQTGNHISKDRKFAYKKLLGHRDATKSR